MPFPLHQPPRGLLEMFRLRTLGAQPNLFAEQIIPVVDVTEMYANYFLWSVAVPGTAGGFPISLQDVQSGPQKRYLAISAEITMGANAGTYVSGQIGIESPSLSFPFVPLWPTKVFESPVAGQGYAIGGMLNFPMMPPPGHVYTASFDSDASGSDHVITIRILAQLLAGEN